MLKFKKINEYILIKGIFLLLFSFNVAYAKSTPESFADLAEKLSPSVVNISTTTIIERKTREMPSFPPGSPLKTSSNNLINLIIKEELNH